MSQSVSEREFEQLLASLGAPPALAATTTIPVMVAPAGPVAGDCEFHGPHGPHGCPDCGKFTAEIAGNLKAHQEAEARCEVTELRIKECAHCHPAEDDDPWGPWFPAQYRGICTGCQGKFAPGDQIRADGQGGYLGHCCGNRGERQLATVTGIVDTAAPDNPPPSTLRELRQILMDYEASRPRSMQRALGPSELGHPCQAQIARKLAGCPRRPVTAPTWAPFQGTAVHAQMEDGVVPFWNQQLGHEAWVAEARLTIDPGMDGVDPIEGNSDAFDTRHSMVVDWKLVGKTALTKLQRGQRMGKPPAEQISTEYRTQAHLYGYGQERAGREVKWVRLVLLARSHDFDESAEWTEAYDRDIALTAIMRYYETIDLLKVLDVANQPDMITAVPVTASRDACHWCPFLAAGHPNSWQGCPGDRGIDKVIANAADGLIEAA